VNNVSRVTQRVVDLNKNQKKAGLYLAKMVFTDRFLNWHYINYFMVLCNWHHKVSCYVMDQSSQFCPKTDITICYLNILCIFSAMIAFLA